MRKVIPLPRGGYPRAGTASMPLCPAGARRSTSAIPRLNEDPRSCWLTLGARWIRVWLMIRPGFLSAAERGALIAVARDGLVEHRVARRANAIVLLNDGWNCEEVGSALLLDDDTVREWFGVYQRQGM